MRNTEDYITLHTQKSQKLKSISKSLYKFRYEKI